MQDERKTKAQLINELAELRQRVAELEAAEAERVQAEEALRRSELRFRSLIEQTTDAVFCYEYDPPIPTIGLPIEEQVKLLYDCVLVECNDVCARSYGATRAEEVIGKRLTELFGTSPGSLGELFAELIQGGYRIVDGEGVEVLEDGTKRYYLNNGHGVVEDGMLLRVWGTFRDITDRKRAEEALREREHQLRLLTDVSPAYIAYVGADDLRYHFVNQKFEIAFGRPREEIVGKHIKEIIGESNYEFALKYIEEVRSGKETSYENVFNLEQGQRWIKVNYAPDFDKERRVKGIVVLGYDITERKRTEEALLISEERLALAVEVSGAGVYDHTVPLGPDTYHSEHWAEILGYKLNELPPYDRFLEWLAEQVHPDDRRRLWKAYSDFVEGRTPSYFVEIWMKHKSGEWICVQGLSKAVERDEYGRATRVVGVMLDITERKQAEEALRQSERKYRLLFENMTAGFALHEMIYDEQGQPADYRYLEINPAFEKLTGVPTSALLGKTVKEVLPNTEQYWIEVSGKVAQTGEPIAYQNYSRELGKYYDTWLFSPAQDQFAVVFTDITERVQAEQERERLIGELQEALDNIKTLKGLIPICANCKKIRDDEGYWQDVAVYVRDHSEAEFSHGLCPDCVKELYSDFYEDDG